MPDATRVDRLIDAFATLADTLVEGYDVVDLLHTLVETCHTLDAVAAAGIMLADGSGELELLASSTEEQRLVDVMHLNNLAGPGAESFATGSVVELEQIDDGPPSWETFRARARELDFSSTLSIPMRLRDTRIGVLVLFRHVPGALLATHVRAAQALADVATIGILHERTLRESSAVQQHLTHALNSRIVIEQAKGVLAHTHDVSMEEAFTMLRTYARNTRSKLSTIARQVVDRELTL